MAKAVKTFAETMPLDKQKGIDLLEVAQILWKKRWWIAKVVFGVTVIAAGVSFLLPEYFRSTAVLLPETEKGKLASLGGISDLAALAGVNVGGEGSLAKLYPTILRSESVLRSVMYAKYQTKKFKEPVDLLQFWEIEERTPERSSEVALKTLREELEISLDNKTNVVSISIETREPSLSADIVNNVIGALDKFFRTKKTTNAGEQRKFIEGRLVEIKADLEKAENTLKEFRENNRQISSSPQLLLEQERLIREVQINTTIYVELKKQYEIVKIEEIKNIPIVNVMDAARPAQWKERPKRARIVVTSFITMVLATCYYAFGKAKYWNQLNQSITKITAMNATR